jgi:hypothetical protein
VGDGAAPVVESPRPPIRLFVAGEDVMLAGRFDHWRAMALDESSPEQGGAQVLLDVTGTAPAGAEELFSFTARSVEGLGDSAYVAHGLMRRGEEERWTDAVIQAPAAHSPFVMITFTVDRTRLPEVWSRLAEHVGAPDEKSPTARALPVPPLLAAA